MKRTKQCGKRFLAAAIAAAILLGFCACGRQKESTEEAQTNATLPAASTAAQTAAQESSPAQSSKGANPSGNEDLPEEDPWAEGYFYDETLTAALWVRFATDNTNDTDENHPGCTMTPDFLAELDRRAHAWLYDGISDRDTEHAMLALSFRFPQDAPGTERGLKSVRAGIYSFAGADPESLAARIRLGNTEACFYLFLRAYYSPAENRTRIYMINGLVW